VVMERMLASVSTRRYARTGEPVGSEVEAMERSTSKSSVSRTFIERTRRSLGELMSRPWGANTRSGEVRRSLRRR
jgi:putative transposase